MDNVTANDLACAQAYLDMPQFAQRGLWVTVRKKKKKLI
jgi:hypothetical protein